MKKISFDITVLQLVVNGTANSLQVIKHEERQQRNCNDYNKFSHDRLHKVISQVDILPVTLQVL